MALKILVLSGYDATSHHRWASGLIQALEDAGHQVESLALPARNYPWRVRSNALTWAFESRDILQRSHDVVVASSAVDVASLRGLVPSIATTPVLTCFHENQFAYPLKPGARRDAHLLIRDLYTALASDHCVFNSDYNRRTFLEGARRYLKRMPDGAPLESLEAIENHASVLHVPIDAVPPQEDSRESVPHILWNHRWEWDKAPERFFDALRIVQARGVEFRLSVVGQSFRTVPDAFDRAEHDFRTEIANWGWQESREAYRRVLAEASIVVSTALHEFQGLAVLEACAHGCTPLVPDRLAYTELFGPEYRYGGDIENAANDAEMLASRLIAWAKDSVPPSPDMRAFMWPELGRTWVERVAKTASDGRRALP